MKNVSLRDQLTQLWQEKRFFSSTIIYTNHITKDLEQVYDFLSQINPGKSKQQIQNNQDIYEVFPDSKTSIIGVDLIRDLKQYYYIGTASLKNKFCIIVDAQTMNLNAQNAS